MEKNAQITPAHATSGGRGKSAARRHAAAMLAAIERGKTLDEARDRLGDLSGADRAFAAAMVMTALRRRGTIEAALAPHLKRPVPARPHLARALLHIGVAQILFMDVPPHAAINETVAATGRREQPYRRFINAVLRRVIPCNGVARFLQNHPPATSTSMVASTAYAAAFPTWRL